MDELSEATAMLEEARAGDVPQQDPTETQPAEEVEAVETAAEEDPEGPISEPTESEEEEIEAQPPEEPADEATEDEEEQEASGQEEPEQPRKSRSTYQRMKGKIEEREKQVVELQDRDQQWAEVANGYRLDAEQARSEVGELRRALTEYGHEEHTDSNELRAVKKELQELRFNSQIRDEQQKKRTEQDQTAARDRLAEQYIEEATALGAKYGVKPAEILLEASSPRVIQKKMNMEQVATYLSAISGATTKKKQLETNRRAPKPVGEKGRAKTIDYPATVDGATDFILARRSGN